MKSEFRLKPPGSELRRSTSEDAAIIKGMLARGDKQSDIAAYWSCNSGRIAETNTGQRYGAVMPAPAHLLPPPGPHVATDVRIIGIEKTNAMLAKVLEGNDHILRQLAAFGRNVGALENPQTPRIGRRRPLEA
jgi:hypothetical protein